MQLCGLFSTYSRNLSKNLFYAWRNERQVERVFSLLLAPILYVYVRRIDTAVKNEKKANGFIDLHGD